MSGAIIDCTKKFNKLSINTYKHPYTHFIETSSHEKQTTFCSVVKERIKLFFHSTICKTRLPNFRYFAQDTV